MTDRKKKEEASLPQQKQGINLGEAGVGENEMPPNNNLAPNNRIANAYLAHLLPRRGDGRRILFVDEVDRDALQRRGVNREGFGLG